MCYYLNNDLIVGVILMKKKKSIWRKLLIIIPSVLLSLFIALIVLLHISVITSFSRGGYPDYPTTNYLYEHYEKDYPRTKHEFKSGANTLRGYLYGDTSAERLVVFSHGLGGGHESYMPEMVYMIDNGYQVFAYDATGSATSDGKSTVGLTQSALDLEAALAYIDNRAELNSLPKYLMGHSWGGFAVAEALGYRDDITAVASLAGYAYPHELLMEEGSKMAGIDMEGMDIFFHISQILSFGPKNYRRNAVDSINKSETPILLVHGTEDETISFERTSIISKQDKLTNPNAKILVLDKAGQNSHMNFFHASSAIDYIAEKNVEFKRLMASYNNDLPLDVRQAYVDSVDLDLVNQVNEELFTEILSFFEQAS